MIGGLKDNTIELIATDHAPHAREKKMREIDQAPFGIIGLETLIPIIVTSLIETGHLTWPEALAKLTCNPAALSCPGLLSRDSSTLWDHVCCHLDRAPSRASSR